MKHRLLLFALLLVLLTSCAKTHRKYVIGVSQCSVDIWRDKFNEELLTSALITDSLTIRLESANDDDRKQTEQINKLLDDGVDLLIVSPNQLKTMSSAIDRAHEKGVPVILYDRKISSNSYTAFIGCDNYQIGLAMGRHIASRLGRHGRIVEITGLEGSSPAVERHRGFADAIKKYPNLQIVAKEAGDWKEESGGKAMERILKETRDFDFVFCHNDRMAVGARKVAMRQGLSGYRYTGVDGLATENGGLELVRNGALDASYLYPTKGNEVIALAMKILTGKPYERENYLQASIVTTDNAELSLMEAHDAEQQRANLSMLHRQVDSYVAQYESQKIITIGLIGFLALLIVFIVVVYRSLTVKARLNEQIAELTHSRLVFFTNISHELRTPLTLIVDPVNRLLADKTITGQGRSLLELIKRNAASLQQLVDAILDFRKIQNGKMELSLAEVNLPMLLHQWVGQFEPSAQQKQITLHVDTTQFGEDSVVSDADKLARIVFNLMSNALKYTPAGGDIFVTLARVHNNKATLSVRDTGKGISAADRNRIFDRFFQSDGAAAGTGIGLAIVKSFAELLGGEASVVSKEGEGAEFMVTFSTAFKAVSGEPKVSENSEFSEFSEPAEPSEQPAPSAEKLLIIDDNTDIRRYIRTVLASRYAILEATNGAEGLDTATSEVPDLVLCDVMMPVMDGLELCKRLKAQTATSHIPVILLTAKNLEEQRAEGYESGADSYITKPFDSNTLLSRIANLLKQRESLRQLYLQQNTTPTESRAVATTEKAAAEPKAMRREDVFLTKVRTILDEHLADNHYSVDDLAGEVGLSRVQLYRKVKALTGSSAIDLLRKTRLAKARELLETTDKTISEVAYDTGFSAPSYFTKCFREEYGITPGEFCQQS